MNGSRDRRRTKHAFDPLVKRPHEESQEKAEPLAGRPRNKITLIQLEKKGLELECLTS